MRSRKFPEEISEAHQDILDAFYGGFSVAGFLQVDPEPLIPRTDDSVIFTNATITSLKPLISNRAVPVPGVFLIQPCLRVQNIAKADQGGDLAYMSYFKMPGVLGHPDSLDALCAAASKFFFQRLGIDPNDFIIRANDECGYLARVWQAHCPCAGIEWDSRPSRYYRWTYGMPGVDGIGFTFAIKHGQAPYEDCGNLVAMRLNGEVVGYEFGVGLETMIARMHGLSSPFEAALISALLPFHNSFESKMLQDCIVVASVLLRMGIRPGTGRARYIAKRVVATLYDSMKRLELGTEELVRIVDEFEMKEFGSETNLGDTVQKTLEAFEDAIRKRAVTFEDVARGRFHLATKRGLVLDLNQLQKLRDQGLVEYRLNSDTVEAILSKYRD